MSVDRQRVISTLRDWMFSVEEHQAETQERLNRGRGPCPGDDSEHDLMCSECCFVCGTTHHTLGNSCPDVLCSGTLEHKYDPSTWTGRHDMDGGECWRCAGLDPHFFEGSGAVATLNRAEPEFTMSASMVRDLLVLLDDLS